MGDCPTATTCHIVWSHARFSATTIIANNTATAHFQDGSTYTVYAFDASDTNDYATYVTINNDTGCTMRNKRGQTLMFAIRPRYEATAATPPEVLAATRAFLRKVGAPAK